MLGQSSNLRPNLGAQSPPTRPSEEPFPTAGSCHMYRPAPLRGRSPFDGKKVLLIDGRQATREVRENVLRSHGIEVDAAESLQSARVLWKPHRYDLVLLDVRRQFPGEAIQYYERSEEHTSELQSRLHLVCRLLLEKKKQLKDRYHLQYEQIPTQY